jgi:Kdo2-lipid IVA lauroyltransferase/acyltransferase
MIVLRWLSRLPLPVLHRLADLLYLLLVFVIRYRRRVIVANLSRSFPHLSDADRRAIVRGFYRNLTDVLIETIKLISISADELRRRVRFTNPEVVRTWLDRGQPVLVMASHQANWEWLPAATVLNGLPADSIYKPLNHGWAERLVRQIRSRFGPHLVPMSTTGRAVVTRQHIPRLIALVADQMPDSPEHALWLPFLHQDTPFYPGSERLARSRNLPVFYVENIRLRRGHYQVTFHPLGEPPYTDLPEGALLERYRDELEKTIRAHPASWLWSHKRWKHQRDKYEGRLSVKLT